MGEETSGPFGRRGGRGGEIKEEWGGGANGGVCDWKNIAPNGAVYVSAPGGEREEGSDMR